MKLPIILLSLLFLCRFSTASAQTLALNEARFVQHTPLGQFTAADQSPPRSQCFHRRGYGGVVVSVCIMAGGGAIALAGAYAGKPNFDVEVLGLVIGSLGYQVFLISGLVNICSKANNGHWPKRCKVVGNHNQVGVAYSF